MRRFTYLLLAVLCFGCSKKEVQLPLLHTPGIQELHNHSQVWFFYNDTGKDTTAIINRKNTISTTHWIYNIDKRLPLNTFVNELAGLKYKHANSIHSEEGMHDYFSYADTLTGKLSFLEFDNVSFKTDSIMSKYYIKSYPEDYIQFNNLNITINPNNVWINDAKFTKAEFEDVLLPFIDFSAEDKITLLHLNFNQRVTYQHYLYYKTYLNSLLNESIQLNSTEFIFDQNKVPDCGCE